MVAEVVNERAALPLLALATSRMWDQRNRDSRLLTRHAYDEMGGLSGALAQHAEATLRAIGDVSTPIVREIFRNLVSADGRRETCAFEELISSFPDAKRDAAEKTPRQLIDARLLTSFEVDGNGDAVDEAAIDIWSWRIRSSIR